MNKYKIVAAFLLGIGLTATGSVYGQNMPGTSGEQYEPLRIPKSGGPDFVPGQRDLEVPADAASYKFLLNGIQIDGAQALTDTDFKATYQDLIGTKITLADLYSIANSITTLYRNQGFILSQAVVPAQEIGENGVVKLQVIEGHVSSVQFLGLTEKLEGKVNGFVGKILATKPLTSAVLERYLLLVNDVEGMSISATLVPSSQQGAADLIVQAGQDKVSGNVFIDNRGSRNLGPYQFGASVTGNDLTGMLDSTRLTGIYAGDGEMNYVRLDHNFYTGTEGLHFNLSASAYRTQPGSLAKVLDVITDNYDFKFSTEYPLIRSRNKNISLRAGLDIHNDERKVRDDDATDEERDTFEAEDRLRPLRLGLTFDNLDSYRGLNQLDLSLSQGLDILDATETGSDNLSRPDGKSDFTKLNFYAARLQSLAPNWSLLFAASGQYTSDGLLASEQYGVGGQYFGRAYDASEILGDKGISGKAELRYTRSTKANWLREYMAYGFYDGGQVKRNITYFPSDDGTDSISSAGLGVRLEFNQTYSGYLEAAKPLSGDVIAEGNDDTRIFFQLKGQY